MKKTYCGIDCDNCGFSINCKGCIETEGKPFGGSCVIANCVKQSNISGCSPLSCKSCHMQKQIIDEINALAIPNMDTVTSLNALPGSFINLEYTLPSGQTVKFFDDTRIYLGNQMHKKGADRCYGIVADENYILVCEYGNNGSNPKIIVFKARK